MFLLDEDELLSAAFVISLLAGLFACVFAAVCLLLTPRFVCLRVCLGARMLVCLLLSCQALVLACMLL